MRDRAAIEPGDMVRHWFAGIGEVLSVSGKTAQVQWKGKRPGARRGIAYVRHLEPVERAKREGGE